MALLGNKAAKVPGLQYVVQQVDVKSAIGRLHLLRQHFMTDAIEISEHLEKTSELLKLLKSPDKSQLLVDIGHALAEMHDITATLNSLTKDFVQDDIGLFEIKKFALLTTRLRELTESSNLTYFNFIAVDEVVKLLDPEGQKVPHFYIYDAYNAELTDLRKEYNLIYKTDIRKAEALRLRCVELEDNIREELTNKLKVFADKLITNLNIAGDLDLSLAKAELALRLKLCQPVVAKDLSLSLKGLFNPAVADALRKKNKDFQPVNIDIFPGAALITGANMGGKTVLLKSIALSQYMFQYGFMVPASSAVMFPFRDIMFSLEDEQSELKGLSSFAAEMLKINSIINTSRSHNEVLSLIDEPARTTNPQEGKAIVNALVDIMQESGSVTLITTHYSGILSDCRRLRVAGLKTDMIDGITGIESINDYMDYSLIELPAGRISEEEVPHEAINIARLLKIDSDLLARASGYIKKDTEL